MAERLVEQLASEEFRPEQYKDEYRDRLREVVQKKVAGEEVTIAEEEKPRAQVIDLMDALKASLSRSGARGERRPSAVTEREPAGKRRPAARIRDQEQQGSRRRAQKK
jgi:DNA end-binding protein Ku